MGQYVSHNRTYAVEGMRGAFASPHPPVPARDGQAAWRNPHGPPAAGGHQLVEGLRPSTPPRRKATAYLLLSYQPSMRFAHNAAMNIRLFLGGLRPPKPSRGWGHGETRFPHAPAGRGRGETRFPHLLAESLCLR